MNNDSYIIPFELLPSSIQKCIELQAFLYEHPNITIQKGCELFNVSKSTYCKYNNKIKKYQKSVWQNNIYHAIIFVVR